MGIIQSMIGAIIQISSSFIFLSTIVEPVQFICLAHVHPRMLTMSGLTPSNVFFSSCLPERGARSPQALVGAIMPVNGLCEGGQAESAVPSRLPEARSLKSS
jgi:hypothetical protein